MLTHGQSKDVAKKLSGRLDSFSNNVSGKPCEARPETFIVSILELDPVISNVCLGFYPNLKFLIVFGKLITIIFEYM